MTYFPFSDYWWFYASFTLFVLVLLALDLCVFHNKAHEVSIKESAIWTGIWIHLALVFKYLFYQYALMRFSKDESLLALPEFNPTLQAKTTALEFLTGFVIEKSLAVDNIFIFAVVFAHFGIPKMYQHRVLFWGILGALFFRALFIGMGSVLMQYEWVVIFFGGLLIITGLKMYFAGTEHKTLGETLTVRLHKQVFSIHPKVRGQTFFHRL